MFQIERQKEILSILHRDGKIYVQDLSRHFNVSGATIRKDLSDMESEGLLIRSHGGAVEVFRAGEDAPLEERSSKRLAQKKAIAYAAMAYISSGDSIIVDGGSTLAQFIACLKDFNFRNLTFITNYIPHLKYLRDCEGVTTILTGGVYNRDISSTLGLPAVELLSHFTADKVMLSATSVSVEQGITFPVVDDAQVKKKMLNQAKQRILLTDSSKIGKASLVSAGDLSQIDVLITDWEISSEDVKKIKRLGVEVVIARPVK